MTTHPLRQLFHPHNIAVIGASPDTGRIRGRILEFLAHGDYRGRVVPVNPSYREIHGVQCFDSIAAARAAIGEAIDLAVIVIPARAVLTELERCAATGVRHALIVSSGFAEEGGEQAAVQERIAANVPVERWLGAIGAGAARQSGAPLLRLEHALHGPVSYLIMPLFAFANAGVSLRGISGALTDRVTIGVLAGLLIGKPAGVMLFSWLAVRLKFAHLPAAVSWRNLHGAAWLAGIGFTMSLFVGNLAFGEGELLTAAKVGILIGSAAAGTVGWLITRRTATDPES